MVDDKLISRLYRLSFLVPLPIIAYLWIEGFPQAAVGLAVGIAFAALSLYSIELFVHFLLRPDNCQPGFLFAYMTLKYAVLAAIIYFLVRTEGISLPALACGIGVPAVLLFLVTLAEALSEIRFEPFWGRRFGGHRRPRGV